MAYEKERASAKADIEKAGATGYILNRNTAAHSPCSMLILAYSLFERLGGTVLDADLKLMIPALGIPTLDRELHDVVIASTKPEYAASVGTYEIVDPKPFMPGGIPIYYEVQARKR